MFMISVAWMNLYLKIHYKYIDIKTVLTSPFETIYPKSFLINLIEYMQIYITYY